jgi:hypothetical protein
MISKNLHRTIALFILSVSTIQFMMTAQPSVSFWDAGEISAATYALQIPHPPGEPLFSLVGRIFYLLPLPGNIGFRINLLSVLSSSLAVMLLYLVAVRLIEIYKGRKAQTTWDALSTYISAGIGALAFSFSDTLWFNAVESEVFAASTFLFALMIWLMLVWYEKADSPNSWKYVLLIAYLIGLSIGVHLMSILAIVTVVMVIVLRKYIADYNYCKKTSYIFIGHVLLLLFIALAMWAGQTSQQPPNYDEYKKYDTDFLMIISAVSLVVAGIFRKKIFNRNSFYIPIIVGGIALAVTFGGVVKVLPKILVSLAGDSSSTGLLVLILILSLMGYLGYWSIKHKKIILTVSVFSIILIILGFTTYTMIIIRANQHPPMNENNPDNFSRLISYLNREQYGDWPFFKRRWSGEPQHQSTWANYKSDLDFFWRYQMDHMFNRYVAWNYIGRESWVQDTGVNWKQLYGIPFFVGLLGLYFHFRKDWKMGAAFLVLFFFMGFLTVFYQNQQESQPRERDYFYSGAFFVFAVWIALGIRGLIDIVERKTIVRGKITGMSIGILLVSAVFIPGRMFHTNYFTHDRSKNWLPWDYSYNLLQSCAPNGILITNGDNDTFPLWYLQDVEGVRRDIRIVNLSLLNTEWYIKQLKNETPYGTPKVKINYSDNFVDRLGPVVWKPQNVTISVPPQIIIEESAKTSAITDTNLLNKGEITFTMPATLNFGDVSGIRVQDIVLKEIIQQNAWQRPIYFATTCSQDSKIGLDNFLWMQGMTYKLKPFRIPSNEMGIDYEIMRSNLLARDVKPSKTPQYGYLFRNMNNSKVFYDENHQRMVMNYRFNFIRLADYVIKTKNDPQEAKKMLEYMEEIIPFNIFPIQEWRITSYLMYLFNTIGDKKHYELYAQSMEKTALEMLSSGRSDPEDPFMPYRTLVEIYDTRHDYSSALNILKRASIQFPNVPDLMNRIQYYEQKLMGLKMPNSKASK